MNATWNDVDISAYVDGQLEPATQSRFESDLATNPALRQRVDALRQIVTLMRSVPLREPPRNYLLTPAMVAQPIKRVAPRRPSLLMMRLATSLTALAFVVTVGLNLLRQGVSPTAMVMEQPQAAVEAPKEVVVTRQVELLSAAPTEMPVATAAPAPLQEEQMDKALAPSMASATEAPEAEQRIEATPPQAEPAAQLVPLPATETLGADTGIMDAQGTDNNAPIEGASAVLPTPTPLPAAPPMEGETDAETGIEQSTEAPVALSYNITAEPHAPVRKPAVSPWWIPGILGIVTLCLVGLTYWMSRRR